ncbi:hypothetical protein K443DRAFT_683517 [Laccaria amethystina LaAM-08-1]|uniref:Structural maintenance of chromosomes protein 5 n=1 Tax=Laccaria amethystina LaAM-08-1 TaxID=1095629 RepID=A0A0C9WSL0_9AGAR|nr:hypothetical protein K443DRAFT_683517 [Laccaria amethystina LaAM-08-1]
MPRRGVVADSDDDVPGASSTSTAVKGGKVRVKEEKSKSKGKPPARVDAEDDQDDQQNSAGDQDAEGEGDEGDGVGSPRGAKRTRLNEEGESRRGGSGSQHTPKQKTLPRDVDGYIPGSIVRIQLHNFVTYDFVEFRPGPYLNMIVGPNGTGKSSIACSIALGLNFPPSILGRASELNSFVKIGTDGGYIEIELKGLKGKRNVIVRRTLSATSKSSNFTMNGVAASGNEIKLKMTELNVQVGNLCSFLPQDKVSEFAAMTPQQLLRETQRAAGDERLTSWHDTLISTGKDLKVMQTQIKGEQEQLKQMVERNEGIERDVQRYKERKKIEHEIAFLNVLIPVATYRETLIRFKEIKANQRRLHEKVTKLKAKNAPAHELLKKLDASHKALDKVRDDKKKAVSSHVKRMQAKHTANDKLETEAEDINMKLGQLKRAEKERTNKIKSLGNDIKKQEDELARDPPELPTQEELNDEARQINLERQSLIARRGELDQQLESLVVRKADAKHEYDKGAAELKKLDDADARKLAMMYRWDRETHDAIKWLRANKNLFKAQVFEPPFMCVTVKDKRYSNAVEACFSAGQMKTFVAQSQEDCDTLNHHINDSGALGRKARITTWFRARQDDMLVPPPMNREELAGLHFDGYALDYIDYPEGLQWFLKRELNLHRTAIALNSNAIDVNRTMEVVARPGPNHPGGANFINGTTMNIVTRSRYGRKAVGNMTRDVHPARNFVIPTIDPETKRKYDEIMAAALQEKQLCDEAMAGVNKKLNDVAEEDKSFTARINSVKSRKEEIKNEQKRIATAQSRLIRLRDQLKQYLSQPSADEERKKLRKKLLAISQQRMVNARDYTDLAHAIVPEAQVCAHAGIQYLQVGANRAALQELCNKKDEKFQTALAEFNAVNEAFIQIKDETKRCLAENRQIVDEAPEDIREEYAESERVRVAYEMALEKSKEDGNPPPDPEGVELRSREELENELERQRAKLDLNLNTNPGVVEQYEKRKRDIEQLEKTLEDRQRKADKVERNIKNARDNWQPALEKLVASIGEKFSAAFDRIGCAGEIRISEHEDYDKWAIDILVKFRDSEKLQLLTGQRQSGGERSLTTILYLMSLTEEARAPFSLVDEINQGMDQRAERTVHNSMVEVTCKEDSAQYFLITPKLLPDLNYHKRMKILCVNNGEWLPEERDLGNMMNMIEGYVQRQSRAANVV